MTDLLQISDQVPTPLFFLPGLGPPVSDNYELCFTNLAGKEVRTDYNLLA